MTFFDDAQKQFGEEPVRKSKQESANHRANVWITPTTRDQLKAIGQAHGAAQGRELSPGIRVAAGFHGRLVEVLREAFESLNHDHAPQRYLVGQEIEALLKEIEEAR